MSYRVLAAATNHPDPVNPYYGLFNARSIAALTDRDVEVDVVTPRPFAPPIGPYSEFSEIGTTSQHDGYEVHHPRFFYGLPKRLFYGLSGRSYAKRVPRYVEQSFEVPDVVHAYHLYPDGYGMLSYSREYDIPLFAVAHGAAINDFDEFARDVQAKIRETLEACEKVLCVSEALAKRAREIAPGVDVTVLPIGADPDAFPTEREPEIRSRFGIDPETPVVLFCGQYVERKGVADIIDILPALRSTEAYYLFVGQDGPLREPLEEAVEKAGMSEQVSISYDVPDQMIQDSFVLADLLLLPSYREGRPTVIYEAMATKTAVLASNVGGIQEQVTDGKTGILLQPRNPERLQEELRDLTAKQGQLRKMGSEGYQKLIDNGWTWDAHAEKVALEHEAVIE